ncbi:MATE family efflux transporter [Hyphomonas sp.]|uniref:MATE family efflux transporter n=1 Tax=Hyphomonas sp. TaxID=87 RepID=UPI0032F02D16
MARAGWPAWARASDISDLLRLSVPIAISRMSMMLMGITDAIVLGQYAPGELPFILNSWLPMGVSLGFGMGLLLGTQVLTSELLGIGHKAETGRIFRRGLWVALGLGVVLTALVFYGAEPLFHWIFVTIAPVSDAADKLAPEFIATETAKVTRILSSGLLAFMVSQVCSFYLEALRRPLLVTVVMYVGVVINLVLDLAFVGGWWGVTPMGAEGVAWATTGSRWLLTIAMFILVVVMTPAFRKSVAGPLGEARRQFNVGIGTAISNVAEWGGFNMTYIIATWISLAANSIYGYAIQIVGLCFMFYLGIGSATSVRVAEAFGRGNADQIRNASRLGVAATIIMGIILGIILVLFHGPISRILVRPDAVLNGIVLAPAIASLLFLAAAASIFDGLQATASMALRAQEIVWSPGIIHIGSFFIVMIPACYMLGLVAGRGAQGMMEGAFIGMAVAGVSQTLLLEFKTARLQSKRAA